MWRVWTLVQLFMAYKKKGNVVPFNLLQPERYRGDNWNRAWIINHRLFTGIFLSLSLISWLGKNFCHYSFSFIRFVRREFLKLKGRILLFLTRSKGECFPKKAFDQKRVREDKVSRNFSFIISDNGITFNPQGCGLSSIYN